MKTATDLQTAREIESASWDALLNHGIDCTVCHEVLEDGADMNRDGCDVGQLIARTAQAAYDSTCRIYSELAARRDRLQRSA